MESLGNYDDVEVIIEFLWFYIKVGMFRIDGWIGILECMVGF